MQYSSREKMNSLEMIQNVMDAYKLYEEGKYREASQSACKVLSSNLTDNTELLNCSGILIDSGGILKDISLIRKGAEQIQALLQSIDSSDYALKGLCEYNLSNGYCEEATLLDKQREKEKIDELLNKQKQCLQNSLLLSKHLDVDLRSRILNNYGRLLSRFGREVEAIDYLYDCLNLAPKHAVAMCNCSSSLQKMVNLSQKHNYRIAYEFWHLMHEASKLQDEFIIFAGTEMYENCLNSVKGIEEYFALTHSSGLEGIKYDFLSFESHHTSWVPSPELKQMGQDRLLLTVNPRLSKCVDHYRDDVCFESIVSALNEEGEQRFQRLANAFNHIKEDFATARYLYYQSCYVSEEINQLSSVTYYIQTNNYEDFGLKTGFLKTSFRLAADLLDKCAGFINLYLELDHPEDQVTLNNVWYVKRDRRKGLHSIVNSLISKNPFLFALKDLNSDLYRGHYPAPVRDLRNDATHKRLVLSLYGSFSEYDETLDYDEFKETVLLLLRMAKAATIYLVGMVHLNEEKNQEDRNNSGTDGQVAPLSFQVDFGLSDQLSFSE